MTLWGTLSKPRPGSPMRSTGFIDTISIPGPTFTLFGSRDVSRMFMPLISIPAIGSDRKSVVQGKSVSVRVDLGGRSIFKKQKTQIHKLLLTAIHQCITDQ